MGALIVRREGAVLTLELSHPGKANAIDHDLLDALDAQLRAVEADVSVRVVVLRGQADGAFSSGADIRDWAPMTPDDFARDLIARGNAIFRRLERLRCPTVAVVEGVCFGGGLELALCCDLRLGTSAARFRFPEVAIGAIPGWEGGTRLAQIAGQGRALEAVLTSREVDAPTALRWGVLNAAVSPEALPLELATLCDRLSSVSPRAATLAKSLIVDAGDPGADAHAAAACEAAARAIKSSRDADVGIRAFIDKKTPVF